MFCVIPPLTHQTTIVGFVLVFGILSVCKFILKKIIPLKAVLKLPIDCLCPFWYKLLALELEISCGQVSVFSTPSGEIFCNVRGLLHSDLHTYCLDHSVIMSLKYKHFSGVTTLVGQQSLASLYLRLKGVGAETNRHTDELPVLHGMKRPLALVFFADVFWKCSIPLKKIGDYPQ